MMTKPRLGRTVSDRAVQPYVAHQCSNGVNTVHIVGIVRITEPYRPRVDFSRMLQLQESRHIATTPIERGFGASIRIKAWEILHLPINAVPSIRPCAPR